MKKTASVRKLSEETNRERLTEHVIKMRKLQAQLNA